MEVSVQVPPSRYYVQLLPPSSTGEQMNLYASFWMSVTEGGGPQQFCIVLPAHQDERAG
jgi:hypothetical protein